MLWIKRFITTLIFAVLAFNAKAQVDIKSWSGYNKDGLWEILLEFDIQKGWHIFAPYNQEFGSPLLVDWHVNEDTAILESSFSRTKTFNTDGFIYDGYEDKAFYKTTMKTSGIWRNIKADISWQACADGECMPQSIVLTILPQESNDFAAKLKEVENNFSVDSLELSADIVLIIIMAFLGGMILNLMPCVLPVLGLKAVALLKMEPQNRIKEALFYTLGVVLSMLVVAGLLLVFRHTASDMSWGFQMQNPWFVGIMLIIFILLTLLSLDLLQINGKWISYLSCLHFKDNRIEAFASGLLAVIIASPCTAPFMGAAIGYALMSPVYVYFPIFLFLGIGYALPFALLALFPQFTKKIMPRSGKWMKVLKNILSIPLLMTCLWLGWLLLTQVGWMITKKDLVWQEYSTTKVEQSLKEKRPVFIDFTADWCITCLMNRKTSLHSATMADLSKKKNILLLKADMTNLNPQATKGLKLYNRASVPLYIYYDGRSDDYLILPQILTPNILQEYIK